MGMDIQDISLSVTKHRKICMIRSDLLTVHVNICNRFFAPDSCRESCQTGHGLGSTGTRAYLLLLNMAAPWACLGYMLATTRASASLVQYDFSQADCRRGSMADVAGGETYFGELVLNKSWVTCLEGAGAQGTVSSPGWPAASSTGNTTAFMEVLQGPDVFPGFAVEVWLSISNDTTCARYDASGNFLRECHAPILTIGRPTVLESSEYCKDHSNMEIVYRVDYRNFLAVFNGGYKFNFCLEFGTAYKFPTEALGYAFHLVFSVKETYYYGQQYSFFEWFINGSRVANGLSSYAAPALMMSNWDADYVLHLLDRRRWPDSTLYTPLKAKLFRVALHNGSFDTALAFSRYSSGSTNSTPNIYDSTVDIMEDGELGDHYDEPEYYRGPFPPAELRQIPLSFSDADRNPVTPNYNNLYPKIFVYALPNRGFLVTSSGEEVISTPFEVLEVGGMFNVRYRPPYNDYGNEGVSYTSFSFFATDRYTGSQSFTNATVTVNVFSKNDPPVALNSSHVVYVGTKHNMLALQSTDVDADDYIQAAFIVETPTKGKLYQVCPRRVATSLDSCRSFKLSSRFVSMKNVHCCVRLATRILRPGRHLPHYINFALP